MASCDALIARAPATIRDRKVDSTSTSPTFPRTVILVTRNAETKNVSPFAAKATGGGPRSKSTAESAGPNARAKLSIVPESALAAARSSSVTTDGVMAVTAG